MNNEYPIYFMRENHTFKKLSADINVAIEEIDHELSEGHVYGALTTKRPGAIVHHFGNVHRSVSLADARNWLNREYADRATEAGTPATAVEMPKPGHYGYGAREPDLYSERQMKKYGDARAEEARREGYDEGHADGRISILEERRTAGGELVFQMRATKGSQAGRQWYPTDADGPTCIARNPHWADLYEFRTLCVVESVEEAAAQADGARFTDVVDELREFASNPGYSHGDYADTMRQAANTIESLRAGIFNYGGIVADQPAAAPTAQPTPPDDERARFENWITCGQTSGPDYDIVMARKGNGQYKTNSVAYAWKVWKAARAALRHPPVPNVGEQAAKQIEIHLQNQREDVERMISTLSTEPSPEAAAFYADVLAAQPTQAGAEPAAAATTDTLKRFSPAIYFGMPAMQGHASGNFYMKAEADAAIAAAREEGARTAKLTDELIEKQITDLRARLASAGAGVPEGWKLVPLEPTREMIASCQLPSLLAIAAPFIVASYKQLVEAAPQPVARQDSAA